jgi:hypothetical protein
MNAQDETVLAVWQKNRHVDRERMAKLLDDCFTRPPVSETEYDAVLRDVGEEMAHA